MDEAHPQPVLINPQRPFQVGDWLIEPDAGCLKKNGQEVRLEPKVMDLLVYLAQRPGKVVSREELEQAIWAGTVVGYDALTSAIIKLRKAFDDDSRHPWLIETLSKKGYRFIASVTRPQTETMTAPPISLSVTKRNYLVAFIISIAILAGGLAVWQFSNESISTDGIPATVSKLSIVVLPFANSNKDQQQEYFSDGITDDLINDLSRFSGLNVVPRRSAYIYKYRQSDIQSIAKELGVNYVLDGDIRRDGNKLRLNVQLINANTGVNIWAQRFDRETKDIFEVQDDIRKNIISALSLTITQEERKREQVRYTSSFDAYDYFLQGQAKLVSRASAADNAQAIEFMQQAIKLDPNFARAYAALAYIYVETYRFAWSEDLEKTRQEALTLGTRAIELDPQLYQAYWIMGNVYLFLYEDHGKAVEMGKRAIELAPDNSDGLLTLAVSYSYGDSPAKAKLITEDLIKSSTAYSSLVLAVLGQTNLLMGNHPEALAAYNKSLEINPTYLYANALKIVVLYRMGRKEDALFQVDELYNLHPDFDVLDFAARLPYKDKTIVKAMVEDLIRAGVKPPA